MGQVTAPPDSGSASTNTTSFVAQAETSPAEADGPDRTAGAAGLAEMVVQRRIVPPAVSAAGVAVEVLGTSPRLFDQIGLQSTAALAMTNFQSPVLGVFERWQTSMRNQWVWPIQSIINDSLGRWLRQGEMLRAAFAMPQAPWWTDLDLWPTDGLMTSVTRTLDLVRPQLLDMSRTLDDLFSATRWIEKFSTDLWRDLRQVGGRIAYWAVYGALAALDRGDFDQLKDFIDCWLDAAPTQHRVEALVEALLELDVEAYHPADGHQLLADLAGLVGERTTDRRRDNETLLGRRRGVGTIARIAREDLTVLHRLGLHSASLEDGVLDRVQPDVDPRVVELVNDLPPLDRKIAMLKIVSGCAWSAAAVQSGAAASRGEVVRRRLTRCRAALPDCTDPWAEVTAQAAAHGRRGVVGTLRTDIVVVDGAVGIWP